MFPWCDNDNPLESLFKKPSNFQLYDQNPISKQSDHDSPLIFSNFPSPFFDEHELPLNQILPHHYQQKPATQAAAITDQTARNNSPKKETAAKRSSSSSTTTNTGSSKLKKKAVDHHPISNAAAPPQRRRNLGAAAGPRKRAGKKDRHSKICTAQGIRDRRMRLSLQVARKFFDLQDMLGYDKASKTIEWLFNKSKKAIKDLTVKENAQGNNINISISDAKSESFISECEVVSGIEENSNNVEIKEGIKEKKSRKNVSKQPNTRESREKARARARSRTREKMMMMMIKSSPNQNVDDLEKLVGCLKSPMIFDQEERVSAYDIADDTIEKLLGNSSSSASNCVDPNSSFMGFLGNWDLLMNNIDRRNSISSAVTNDQVSMLAGNNPNSIYSSATTPDFPLFHQ